MPSKLANPHSTSIDRDTAGLYKLCAHAHNHLPGASLSIQQRDRTSPRACSAHEPRPARTDRARRSAAAPRLIRLGSREVLTQGIPREILLDLYHHFMT